MSYKNLKIWEEAKELHIAVHKMTLKELPAFEKFETGSQLRRSIKSVRSNIVEGYGRRRYKAEFVRFLIFSEASLDESKDHIEGLYETQSLKDEEFYGKLIGKAENLGKQLRRFIEAVERQHNNPK